MSTKAHDTSSLPSGKTPYTILYLFILLLNFTATFMIKMRTPFLQDYFITQRGLSALLSGMVESSLAVGFCLGMVPAVGLPWLSRKWGLSPLTVNLSSYTLVCLLHLLTGAAGLLANNTLFITSSTTIRITTGYFLLLQKVTVLKVAGLWFPSAGLQTLHRGLFLGSHSAGLLAGNVAGAGIYEAVGYVRAYLLTGGGCLLAGFITLVFCRLFGTPHREASGGAPYGSARKGPGTDEENQRVISAGLFEEKGGEPREKLSRLMYLPLLGVYFVSGELKYLGVALPYHFKVKYGYSLTRSSLFMLVGGAVLALSGPLIASIFRGAIERFRFTLFFAGCGVCGMAAVVAALGERGYPWIGCFLIGVFENIVTLTAIPAMVSLQERASQSGKELCGADMDWISTLWMGVQSVSTWSGALYAGLVKEYLGLLWGGAVLAVGSGVVGVIPGVVRILI